LGPVSICICRRDAVWGIVPSVGNKIKISFIGLQIRSEQDKKKEKYLKKKYIAVPKFVRTSIEWKSSKPNCGGTWFRFPAGAQIFRHSDRFWDPPVSYAIGTGKRFPGVKQSGA
jgi:hypothetical protein